jgi:2-dehydro-3-deoxyphosphogluconate aldolase/(4S)-4-hydroxy-2-oxoglutarate aldolase
MFETFDQRMIPVLNLSTLAEADLVAERMSDAGLKVLELTLRNGNAIEVLRHLKASHPHLVVGMGTITSPVDLRAVKAAGADFGVTPGTTTALYDAMREVDLPVLPGIATASEAMQAMDRGHTTVKVFPAAQVGLGTVRAWSGPLSDLKVCATGGLDRTSAEAWLALPNVAMVGGGWMAPKATLAAALNGEAQALDELKQHFDALD